MPQVIHFLKDWTLPISMTAGATAYLLYAHLSCFEGIRPYAFPAVCIVQPALLFFMLFLTFCKVNPRDLRLCRWHFWQLFLQLSAFGLCVLVLMKLEGHAWAVVVEGGMLCLICPTATAAAVVTNRLGGNAATLTTYTILINLAVSLAIPALLPFVQASGETGFFMVFWQIIRRVFPLLFCPFLTAIVLRRYAPQLTAKIASVSGLAFYVWAVSLAMAISVTVRSICHSHTSWFQMSGIAIASLLACVVQFAAGRWIGQRYADTIACAQSLGQKNTVFAIWMGYTFLDPVTSLAGGFYSIWHNVWNSLQLYAHNKTASLTKK